MKKAILGLAAVLALAACSENKAKGKDDVYSAIESSGENEAAYNEQTSDLAKKEAEAEAQALASVTTLKFDKEVHDFGAIRTGSENDCEFKVTNTGKNPLVIESVKASCGCTTPKKPEKPIAPGASDVIEVHFKPNGPGPSEKTVTIVANTEPRISTVKVKADVK
jgi:hypothetical protein